MAENRVNVNISAKHIEKRVRKRTGERTYEVIEKKMKRTFRGSLHEFHSHSTQQVSIIITIINALIVQVSEDAMKTHVLHVPFQS